MFQQVGTWGQVSVLLVSILYLPLHNRLHQPVGLHLVWDRKWRHLDPCRSNHYQDNQKYELADHFALAVGVQPHKANYGCLTLNSNKTQLVIQHLPQASIIPSVFSFWYIQSVIKNGIGRKHRNETGLCTDTNSSRCCGNSHIMNEISHEVHHFNVVAVTEPVSTSLFRSMFSVISGTESGRSVRTTSTHLGGGWAKQLVVNDNH